MIQEQASKTSSQIPLLGDLPGLGPIFSDRSNSVRKTELVILITPRVVRDGAESRLVTEEYRRKMRNVYMPRASAPVRGPVNTLRRMTMQ
jgi:general secretion pathway protein D